MGKDYRDQKRHIYVASSFFVSEISSSRSLIRTLAVAEKSLFDPEIICDIDGRFFPANVRRLELFIGCKWGSYFIECPAEKSPEKFYLRGDNSLKHEIQLTKPQTKKRGFVVCFSRMFFFERWQAALTALQMYKFHGVDMMVLPVISMIKEMYEILRAYEIENIVRIKPAAVIPNIPDLDYNPNSEVDWFLQVLNFNECLYEYRESADFIAFADLDDIMVPRHSLSLHSEMMQIATANPNLASFEFNWLWSTAIIPPEPEKFNLDALIGSIFVQFDAPGFGKPVVIPKRVREGFIHHPEVFTMRGEILPGFSHKWFKENSTTVIHLRHIFTEPHQFHPNLTNTFFGTNPKYRKVQEDFRQFLNRNPNSLKAFNRLPTKMSYYKPDKCLKDAKFNRCHSGCMPEESPDFPECVVLEFDSKSTRISNNWEIYTTDRLKSKFSLKRNCLM